MKVKITLEQLKRRVSPEEYENLAPTAANGMVMLSIGTMTPPPKIVSESKSVFPIAIPPVTVAIPPDKWAAWTIPIKAMRAETDKGIGDTVARTTGYFGGEKFKAWYKGIFGKSCGCDKRQAEWNRLYPYVD